jgi:hypothetical protein
VNSFWRGIWRGTEGHSGDEKRHTLVGLLELGLVGEVLGGHFVDVLLCWRYKGYNGSSTIGYCSRMLRRGRLEKQRMG